MEDKRPEVTVCTDRLGHQDLPFTNGICVCITTTLPTEATRQTLETDLEQALVDLRTMAQTTTKAEINADPALFIKAVARLLIKVIRLLLRRFDSTT